MDKLTKIVGFLPELAFFGFTIRTIIYGAGIGDALAIVSLVSFIAYNKFLVKSKIEDKEELDTRIKNLEASVNSLQMDKVVKRQSNEPKIQTGPRKLF